MKNMKKILIFMITFLMVVPFSQAEAVVSVKGYYRKDGTYVAPHYRSDPDGIKTNNWSYPGNTNPYTGKTAGGSVGSYTPSYSNYYAPTYISSCPANSYSSGSSCICNFGYVVSGSSCVSANSLCQTQIGIMSSYDSLSGDCKCDYGYAIGTSGNCEYKSTYQSPSYSSTYSDTSCPVNSSKNSIGGCSCDFNYKVNAKKDKCIKMTKKDNDKICQLDFGKKSEWSGEYHLVSETPTCVCKNKYEWGTDRKSCIKTK